MSALVGRVWCAPPNGEISQIQYREILRSEQLYWVRRANRPLLHSLSQIQLDQPQIAQASVHLARVAPHSYVHTNPPSHSRSRAGVPARPDGDAPRPPACALDAEAATPERDTSRGGMSLGAQQGPLPVPCRGERACLALPLR